MSMLDGEWAKAVGAEFKKPYYRDLYNFVRDEYATHVVYPPADDIFNAMHFTENCRLFAELVIRLYQFVHYCTFC